MTLPYKRRNDDQIKELILRSNNCLDSGVSSAALVYLLQSHTELLLRIMEEQDRINERLDKISPPKETDDRFESLDYLDR